jgi:hypothetical protein
MARRVRRAKLRHPPLGDRVASACRLDIPGHGLEHGYPGRHERDVHGRPVGFGSLKSGMVRLAGGGQLPAPGGDVGELQPHVGLIVGRAHLG